MVSRRQGKLYPLLFECAAQSLLEFGRNRLHGDRVSAQIGVKYPLTHLLQLTEFSFKTIKYWSGFADDCRSKTLKCSANIRIKEF